MFNVCVLKSILWNKHYDICIELCWRKGTFIYLIFIYLYYITIYAVLYKKFQIVVICVWDILKVKTKMYKLTILYNE